MPEIRGTAMPAGDSGDQPHDRLARAADQIRTSVPGAVRVRAHVAPNGAYCTTAVDADGAPVMLSATESDDLGAWVIRALPDVDRSLPRILDLATGRVTCALTGDDLTTTEQPAVQR